MNRATFLVFLSIVPWGVKQLLQKEKLRFFTEHSVHTVILK
jgi:hypothetical protein